MKTIRIYRHPHCEKCARFARMHHRYDWFDKVEDTVAPPPHRPPLRKGEVVIQTLADGRLHEGVDAARCLVKAVPLYWPILPLLWLAPVRRRVEMEMHGACAPAADLDEQIW